MDSKEIQAFIDETIYDFQTLECLLERGRMTESLAFVRRIAARIEQFKASAQGPYDLKPFFSQSFWDQGCLRDFKAGEPGVSIQELIHSKEPVSQATLEALSYRKFVSIFRSWIYSNIAQLRQIIKTPSQKRVELILIVLATGTLGVCLALMIFVGFFLKDLGLRGDFYQGKNFEKYLFTRSNKTIDFSGYQEMNPRMPRENVSVRWQGDLLVPQAGQYTFFIKSDDGVRLFLDGNLVIDGWQDNDSAEFEQSLVLAQGKHDLRLEYYNNQFGAVLRLSWAFEGRPREVIPAWHLRIPGQVAHD